MAESTHSILVRVFNGTTTKTDALCLRGRLLDLERQVKSLALERDRLRADLNWNRRDRNWWKAEAIEWRQQACNDVPTRERMESPDA